MDKPEALRLADALTQPTYPDWVMHIPAPWHPPAQKVREAAAELRRLHSQRDALLRILREYVEDYQSEEGMYDIKHYARKFMAAIAAVEGEKT